MMKNTLFKRQIRHQSTPMSTDSIYIKQQFAVREADQRLLAGFSAACYAVFGSSRVLAVGPVAVVSLMTAATVAEHAAPGTHTY
jgi:hypothetical protein